MNSETWLMLMFITYKMACLTIGALFAYMGYRLFLADKIGPAGDIDAGAEKYRLVIKKAAPGTIFVLFGTFVITFTILKGVEYRTSGQDISLGESVQNVLPEKPPF